MTKTVRIENACNSNYNVDVEVYERTSDGSPDILIQTSKLDIPTSMFTSYLTNTRYMVIKENGSGPR